ncbi:MAG: hypothetical protein R3E08_05095 [Thiotrichaceae bacterium]
MIEKPARFCCTWLSETFAENREQMATPGLSINVVIGSPGTTPETVMTDGLETTRYAVKLAQQYDLPLDINLHPYYPSHVASSIFLHIKELQPTYLNKLYRQFRR